MQHADTGRLSPSALWDGTALPLPGSISLAVQPGPQATASRRRSPLVPLTTTVARQGLCAWTVLCPPFSSCSFSTNDRARTLLSFHPEVQVPGRLSFKMTGWRGRGGLSSYELHAPTHIRAVTDSRSLGRGPGFNLSQSLPASLLWALNNSRLSSLDPYMVNYGQITPLERLRKRSVLSSLLKGTEGSP